MNVSELISFLKKQPQELHVAYSIFSEQCLLRLEDIKIKEFCEPRPDGWIHNKRSDKPTQLYLLFPGN